MKPHPFLPITLPFLLVVLVSGCAGRSGRDDSVALPASTSAGGEVVTFTLAQDGQTITLRPGQRLLLKLGEGDDWTVIPHDPEIVGPVVNAPNARGSQGLYEAHMTGRTVLTGTGDPSCRKVQPPCTLPSRLFRLQVIVQK